MSVEISFLNIESIIVNPVQTSHCLGLSDAKILTQRLVIRFKDGDEHALTLFLPAGQPALALVDLITSEQVSA
jgi:hypothetical protein